MQNNTPYQLGKEKKKLIHLIAKPLRHHLLGIPAEIKEVMIRGLDLGKVPALRDGVVQRKNKPPKESKRGHEGGKTESTK